MNLNLSDEQEFLREAAQNALSRFKTLEAAREGLEDDSAILDLWPTAAEAGWLGLLVSEENGGAGLGAYDAILVAQEAGKVLAGTPLIGALPASLLLDRGGFAASATSLPVSSRPRGFPPARRARWSPRGPSTRSRG